MVYDLTLGGTTDHLKTADYPWGKTTVKIRIEG